MTKGVQFVPARFDTVKEAGSTSEIVGVASWFACDCTSVVLVASGVRPVVSVGVGCASVSLGGSAVALGVRPGVDVAVLSRAPVAAISAGTMAVEESVRVGDDEVGRGVFGGAPVLVGGGLVREGSDVGGGPCVALGLTVGTV